MPQGPPNLTHEQLAAISRKDHLWKVLGRATSTPTELEQALSVMTFAEIEEARPVYTAVTFRRSAETFKTLFRLGYTLKVYQFTSRGVNGGMFLPSLEYYFSMGGTLTKDEATRTANLEITRPEVVSFLLDHGADPNGNGFYGSQLDAAIGFNRLDVVKLLLTRGARPDHRDEQGLTPTDVAKKNKRTEILKLLKAALSQRRELKIKN